MRIPRSPLDTQESRVLLDLTELYIRVKAETWPPPIGVQQAYRWDDSVGARPCLRTGYHSNQKTCYRNERQIINQ